MSRKSTRKRTQISYADLLGDTQPEPSSSKSKRKRKEDSDFEAEQDEEEEADEPGLGEETPISSPPTPVSESNSEPDESQPKQPKKPDEKAIPSTTSKLPRRTSIREANSRTRPCPAFFPNPAVRLGSDCGLFEVQELVTADGERNARNTRKARDDIGMNVGAGPVLDLCEDLGWFKEARVGGAERRPRVYENVRIKAGDWDVVQERCANFSTGVDVYLLSNLSDAEPYISCGQLTQPNSMTCLMGPFGEQQPVQFKRFETCSLDKYWPSSRALVFNAGNPVWGLDWCPTSESFSAKHGFAQYLAVSTIPASPPPSHTGPPPLGPDQFPKSAIQIWRFGASKAPTDKTDLGTATCALIVCLDVPPARMLKWCPLPTDDADEPGKDGEQRKLGILAGVFGDGSITLYAIPEPGNFGTEPAFIQPPRALVRITLPDARFTCLDWANSEVLAFGCSNGHIAVYNLKSSIQGENTSDLPLLPTHYISIHQSRVQSLKWVRIPSQPTNPSQDENPTIIISGGFDGHVYATDSRHPGGMGVSMFRCRDVIQSVAFSSYGAGIISNEHENMVKFTGLQPVVLGRGHNVTEDIATSDLHPQVAVASSDGTLTITNLLKYMRKGSPMPSFVHTIYRMDYNPETKELRMLDMFVPRVRLSPPTSGTQILPSAQEYKDPRFLSKSRGLPQGVTPPNATPAQRITAERERDGFGTWATEIGIHCACWQPCRLAQAGVLASGGASGLVRIDVLKGLVSSRRKDQNGDEDEEMDED
ncbi:hypothetical protein FRC10_011472 [Ceratobasidium sp. 414]|nr:hypothetical protein FRC10_011472 [Ceratobasidium sp. 414]